MKVWVVYFTIGRFKRVEGIYTTLSEAQKTVADYCKRHNKSESIFEIEKWFCDGCLRCE